MRPYPAILARLRSLDLSRFDTDVRMQAAVDAFWEFLAPTGVSWIGFYTKPTGRDEMILGPRRDKPACSPLGMHGACGRCWKERRPLVIPDVATLGAGYVACDPRDRSEVVVPLFAGDGSCWGVLDGDSYDVGAFDESDADGLTEAVELLRLTSTPRGIPMPLVL
ncbi:MAG: GAF domain-containing protein [Phycisphaerales bacterium]